MNELLERLAEPFPPDAISWKPGATKDNKCLALAYADLRAYMQRLDEICGLDWSIEYEPWGDDRIIARLTIAGAVRCSTGEMDAQDEKNNMGGTVAEAQAAKRAAAMFGLGRYLYDLPNVWVEFDSQRKRIADAGQKELDNRYKAWYAKTIAQKPSQERPSNEIGAETDGDSHKAEIEPPDDAEAELMNSWKSPADAQAWAVAMGACENIHEARNSFLNVVNDKFGGKCNKTNIAAIYLVYMRKQESKLEEMFTQFSEKMAAKEQAT